MKHIIRCIWFIFFIKSKVVFLRLLGVKIGTNVRIYTKISNLDLLYIKNLSIGNNVTITKDCKIFVHNGAVSQLKRMGVEKDLIAPVKIKDDVFIGSGSIVLPGIEIGSNSIIGAGSVVTKSVPGNCIVAGNPAKVIKTSVDY